MDLLDIISRMGGTPVRRGVNLRLTYDKDGLPILETVEGEAFSLSPEGSIDRVSVSQDRFYHCGCSARVELGGQCGEPGCGRTSCVHCFHRCAGCLKPICLQHTRWMEDKHGRRVPLCLACEDSARQRQYWSRLTGGLVHPPAFPGTR